VQPLSMLGCSGAWKPSALRVPFSAVVSYSILVIPIAKQELFKIKKKGMLMGNHARASAPSPCPD
jgi:hypothetical protein